MQIEIKDKIDNIFTILLNKRLQKPKKLKLILFFEKKIVAMPFIHFWLDLSVQILLWQLYFY